MIEYILIIFAATSAWANTDSMALTTVPGFKTLVECQAAGNATKSFETTHKNLKFVCVKQTKG